jgi:nitroreductase
MLDLKPTTDDQKRLKTNVLPGEIEKFIQKQSNRQPPLSKATYDAQQRMKEIMEAPQLSAVEKSKLYFDLAMMKSKERERYERFLLNDRPKYIPMKHEDVARLSPEDRQEYENSLKNSFLNFANVALLCVAKPLGGVGN